MNSPENAPWLEVVQKIAEQQSALLEAIVEALQGAQAHVPEPSRAEILAIRERRQPLSLAAYLRGHLQRVILAIEDAACDLRSGSEDEALQGISAFQTTEAFLNAVASSLEKPER